MDELFKLVFGNIVILRNIYNHVRIYKKNEVVEFITREELLKYKEREYISKIEFNTRGNNYETLKVGDLPTRCVLKEVKIGLASMDDDIIPYGVEIVDNCINFRGLGLVQQRSPFSNLPPTVHTIYGALIRTDPKKIVIPPNITSVSFTGCPNISGEDKGNGHLVIPSTLRKLQFNSQLWRNEDVELRKGDIPDGLTSLSLGSYRGIKTLTKGILPDSIKELEIACSNPDPATIGSYCNGIFDFMPPNVESLHIINCQQIEINLESNLYKYTSIKKLNIHMHYASKALENSLPPYLTELTMIHISTTIKVNVIPRTVTTLNLRWDSNYKDGDSFKYIEFKDSIPNNVTYLSLNRIITHPSLLPSSITSLRISYGVPTTQDDLIKMLSILPQSITSISIAEQYKKLIKDISIPSTITIS